MSTLTAEVTPEQAIELANKLLEIAHRVKENLAANPDAYAYVHTGFITNNGDAIKLRLGK